LKIAPLIALLGLAVAVYVKRELIVSELKPLFDPAESLDLDGFNAEVLGQVNVRRGVMGAPLAASPDDLRNWLVRRSVAGGGLGSAQEVVASLQEDLPVYADLEARLVTTRRQREALDSVVNWTPASSAQYTHLATIVTRDASAPDEVVCLAVVARKLPNFEPGLLDQPHAEFCARCPQCGHEQPATVERSPNGVVLYCHDCRRPYAMLCQDLAGKYRYVNEFLTGFEPPAYFPEGLSREEEMLAIWKAVLAQCRYARDAEGIAGPRDYWQTPAETHGFANGDCEDTSILLTDWLTSRGFEARVALGQMTDDNGVGEGHAWVVVRLDGKDYLLETTGRLDEEGRPPTVAAWGHYYSPQYLFDRDKVYFRKTEGWTPDYWSKVQWAGIPQGQGADGNRAAPAGPDLAGAPDPRRGSEAGAGTRPAARPAPAAPPVASASAWLGKTPLDPASLGGQAGRTAGD
jgi:predicted transglutaminase-like cysteine proteinase